MEADLRHPYGLRTWIRSRLPFWLIDLGVANKGSDCESRSASHYWYNHDNVSSACYYCCVVREGRLWERQSEQQAKEQGTAG